MVSSTPRPHFTHGKDSVPILQEAGWAPGPVWTGGKSCPHRDSIPDRPASIQSQYRLSYPVLTSQHQIIGGTHALPHSVDECGIVLRSVVACPSNHTGFRSQDQNTVSAVSAILNVTYFSPILLYRNTVITLFLVI